MTQLFTWTLMLIGGGAGGAVIAYLLKRRGERLQTIPLIERVNRLIDPKVEGYVLARAKGEGPNRELEEIRNVREYQFTLRNTSTVHLHNAEIQFEFSSEDVEAWAERPMRSKTTPIQVEAQISPEWKKGFRWRIPEFPSSDSIDFTFRAVEPQLGGSKYEAALYNSPQVVIERADREPSESRLSVVYLRFLGWPAVPLAFMLLLFAWEMVALAASPTGDKSEVMNSAGCSLYIETSSSRVNSSLLKLLLHFGQTAPYLLDTSVLNTGSQKCFVQFEGQAAPSSIDPGGKGTLIWNYTNDRPSLVPRTMLFGSTGLTNKAVVSVYWGKSL